MKFLRFSAVLMLVFGAFFNAAFADDCNVSITFSAGSATNATISPNCGGLSYPGIADSPLNGKCRPTSDCAFTGYYYNGTQYYDGDGQFVNATSWADLCNTQNNGSITLTAEWNCNGDCSAVTFDYNGGQLEDPNESNPTLYTKIGTPGFFSDSNCTITYIGNPTPASLVYPSNPYAEFKGYYETRSHQFIFNAWLSFGGSNFVPQSNGIILRAYWMCTDTHTACPGTDAIDGYALYCGPEPGVELTGDDTWLISGSGTDAPYSGPGFSDEADFREFCCKLGTKQLCCDSQDEVVAGWDIIPDGNAGTPVQNQVSYTNLFPIEFGDANYWGTNEATVTRIKAHCVVPTECHTVRFDNNGGDSVNASTVYYRKNGEYKWYKTSDCKISLTAAEMQVLKPTNGTETFYGYYTQAGTYNGNPAAQVFKSETSQMGTGEYLDQNADFVGAWDVTGWPATITLKARWGTELAMTVQCDETGNPSSTVSLPNSENTLGEQIDTFIEQNQCLQCNNGGAATQTGWDFTAADGVTVSNELINKIEHKPGFFEDSVEGNAEYLDGATIYPVYECKYTATYKCGDNGYNDEPGTGGGSVVIKSGGYTDPINPTAGESYTVLSFSEAQCVAKTGYVFNGWSLKYENENTSAEDPISLIPQTTVDPWPADNGVFEAQYICDTANGYVSLSGECVRQYNVTYDCGTHGSAATGATITMSNTATVGGTYNVAYSNGQKIADCTPATGYVFDKWYFSYDSTPYNPNDTISSFPDVGSVTPFFTAQYVCDTGYELDGNGNCVQTTTGYTATFDCNTVIHNTHPFTNPTDGSLDPVSVSAVGESVTLPLVSNCVINTETVPQCAQNDLAPIAQGYWEWQPSGGGTAESLSSDTLNWPIAGDIAFHLHAYSSPSYQITYRCGDVEFSPEPDFVKWYNCDNVIIKDGSICNPGSDLRFNGWAVSDSDTVLFAGQYTNNNSTDWDLGNRNLTAQWECSDSSKIYVDGACYDSCDVGCTAPGTNTCPAGYDENAICTYDTSATQSGYTTDGSNCLSIETGQQIIAAACVPTVTDCSGNYIWNSANLTCEQNQQTQAIINLSNSVEHGTNADPDTLYTTHNTGIYSNSGRTDAFTSLTTVPTKYAVLTLNANGGTVTFGQDTGESVSTNIDSTFTGFYETASSQTPFIDNNGALTNDGESAALDYSNGTQTWYAHWTDGNLEAGNLPTPTHNGYVFTGWYDGATSVGNTTLTIGSDKTLTAGWNQCTCDYGSDVSSCVVGTDNNNSCTVTAECADGFNNLSTSCSGTACSASCTSATCSQTCNAPATNPNCPADATCTYTDTSAVVYGTTTDGGLTCTIADSICPYTFSCDTGYYKNNNECTKCPKVGDVQYTTSGPGAESVNACYTSCTTACTPRCPDIQAGGHVATCTDTPSLTGTQYYGGDCEVPVVAKCNTTYTCETDYEPNADSGLCEAKSGGTNIVINLNADGKRTSCPEWWMVVGPSDSGGDNKCRCLAWGGATLNSDGSNCIRYDFSGSSKLTVNHTTNPAEITYDDQNGGQTLISTDTGALWMPQRFLVVHYDMNGCTSSAAPTDATAKWGYDQYYGNQAYTAGPYTQRATSGLTQLSDSGQVAALGYSADMTWYLKWELGYSPIALPTPDCAGYVFDYWSESSQDEAQEVIQCNYDTTQDGGSQYGYLPSKCVSQFTNPNAQNCTATTNYASDDCTDTTLYAHWHPGVFEVKLNVNGGTPGSQNQNQIYEKYATGWATTGNSQDWTSITLSGDQLPQRSGYRFLGYYNAIEGGQLQGSLNNGAWTITTDDATAVTVDTTWYAHWAEIQTYNIYCMPNTSGQNPSSLDMNAIQQGDLIPVATGLEFETSYAQTENVIIRACCKQKDPDTGEYSNADGSVENCCPAGYIMPESVVVTTDVPLYSLGDTVHVWNSYDPDNNGASYNVSGDPWWYLIRNIFSSMDGSAILMPRCEEAPTAICHKIVFDNNSETDSTTNSNVSLFRKDGEPDKWYINSDCTTTESGISLGVRKPSNGNEIFAGYYYGSSKQIFTKNTYTNGIILKPNDEEANNWDVTGLGTVITLTAKWGVNIHYQCSPEDTTDPATNWVSIAQFAGLDVNGDGYADVDWQKCLCPGEETPLGFIGWHIVDPENADPILRAIYTNYGNILPTSFFTSENYAQYAQYLDGLTLYPELICKYDVTYVCHNGSKNYPGTATMGDEYTVKTFDEVSGDISNGCGVPDEHAVFSGWTLDLIEGSEYPANQTSVIQSWPGGNGTFTAQYVCAEGYTNSGTPGNLVCEEQNNTVTFHFICRPIDYVLNSAATLLNINPEDIDNNLDSIYYDTDYSDDSNVSADGTFQVPYLKAGNTYRCRLTQDVMNTGWFNNPSVWNMMSGHYYWQIIANGSNDINGYTTSTYTPDGTPNYVPTPTTGMTYQELAQSNDFTFRPQIPLTNGSAFYKCRESDPDPSASTSTNVQFSQRLSYAVRPVTGNNAFSCNEPAHGGSQGFLGWRARQTRRQNQQQEIYLSEHHQDLDGLIFQPGALVNQNGITAFPPREVYFVAVWDCEDGYGYDIDTGQCVQNVAYMCYVNDNDHRVTDNVSGSGSYAVKALSWYTGQVGGNYCALGDNFNGWHLSGDDNGLHAAGDAIPVDNVVGKTFIPGYTATFECGSCFPNASQHTIYVALGDTINLPTVAQICGAVSSECEGLVDTSLGWKTQYPENIGTSPVTGADCPATPAGQYVDAPSSFSWQCPTDLTFKPIGDFSEEVTHLVCCPYNNNCFEVPGESGPGADYTTGADLQDWIEAHPDLCLLSPCQNGGRAGWVGWKVAASGNNIPTEVMSQMIVDPLHQQTTQYILPFNYTFNNQLLDSHYGFSVKPVAACFYDVTYNCAGYGSGTVDSYVGDMQYQGALYPATVAVWPGGGAVLRGSDGDNGVNYVIKTSSDAQCGRDDGYIFNNWTFSGNPDYTGTNTFNGGDVLPWPHYWFTNGPWWEGHPGTFTANWVWNPNGGQCHTVTFDDNNDVATVNDPRHMRENQTGWYNDNCSEPATGVGNVQIPSRNGDRFTGYKHMDTNTMVFNGNGSMVDPGWTISSDVTLVAQWNCYGTQFYDATTGLCTNCPTEFPYADPGATSAAQCYYTCQDHCNQVGCPVDDCTYINTDVLIDGRIYNNGTNTCVVNNCDWTINSCPPGQYINDDTCESCPTGFTSNGATADDITDCYKTCTADCIKSGCDSETLHAHDPNASVLSCQYTTSTLPGERHCNAANNGTCTDVSACSAASEMCPYTYDCKPLYHHNPETGLCESCVDGEYWDADDELCKSCNLMIHDNHNWITRPPHNTSIDHCYRLCENVTCQTASIDVQNINDVEQFLTNPGGQVSFYGNEQQGLDVCNRNPEVPYCPVILFGQGTSINNEQHAVKPMHLKVNFYDGLEGAHLAGERYIVGPRNSNDILVNGRYGWSQIMGYGQLNTNRRYPIVMYPSFIAPEAASVENLGFIGYYDRQNSQPGPWTVQYTDAGRALNTGNASLVVERQEGNPNIAHNLYARYSECESPNFPDPETGECGWCPEGYTDNPDATSFEECYGYDSCGNGNCNVNCPTGEHIICVPTIVQVPWVQYANNPGVCVPSADCVNTITCDSGYYWNGTSCVPESQYVIHLDYSVDDTNHLLETNPRRNLYTIHNTGVYLDSGRTQQMSTNNNPIEEPHKYINVTLDAMGGTVQDWGSEPGGVVTDRIYFKFKGFYRNQDTVTNGDKFIELRDQYGYITNDGSNAGKSYNADATWYAHWYSTSIDLPSAERDGYQFLGWFTQNGTTPMSMPVRPNDDITYYAHWTKCDDDQIVIDGVCTNCSCTEGNGIEQGTCSAYAVSGNQCNATAECASNYGGLVVNCSGANCTVSCSACDPTANQITINSQCITCNCTSSNSANCGTFSNDNNMCNWSMECMPGYVNLNPNCIETGNTTCNPTCTACTCDPVANTGVNSCPSTVSNDACTYGPTCNPGYHNPEVFECSGTGNTYCKAQCHMCPEGTYGPNGEQCIQCPAGYTAPAGSTSEEDCYGNPNTYKITYLSNNNQNATAVQSVAYNTAFTTKTPSELGFSRLGYIVTQWDVDADSEPTVTFTNYDSENSVHYARVGEPQYEHYLDMHDITLKAHWHICPEGTYQDGNICRDCPAGYNAPAGSYLVEHCYANPIQYKITYQSGTVPQTFYVQSPITVGQSFTTESGTRFNNTGYMMTRWDSVSGGEYPELSHQYTYDVAIDTVLRANWEQCTCPRENWGNGVLNCVPTSVTDENRCTATVTCETGYEPAEPNCTGTVCSVHCDPVKSNAKYACNCPGNSGATGTAPADQSMAYGATHIVRANSGDGTSRGCEKTNSTFMGWLFNNDIYNAGDQVLWNYTTDQTFCAKYCSDCPAIENGTNELVFESGECQCVQHCNYGYYADAGICKPIKNLKLIYRPNGGRPNQEYQRTVENFNDPFRTLGAVYTKDDNIMTHWDVVGGSTNTFTTGQAELGRDYAHYLDATDTTLDAHWEACQCNYGENDGVASCSTPISNNSCGYEITCKPGYVNPHTENCDGTGNLHCNAKCDKCSNNSISIDNECVTCECTNSESASCGTLSTAENVCDWPMACMPGYVNLNPNCNDTGTVCTPQCTQCGIGTYQDGDTCVDCPEGYTTAYPGSTSEDDCNVPRKYQLHYQSEYGQNMTYNQEVTYNAAFTTAKASDAGFAYDNHIITLWDVVGRPTNTFATGYAEVGADYRAYRDAADTTLKARWEACECRFGEDDGVESCSTPIVDDECSYVVSCKPGYVNPHTENCGGTGNLHCNAKCKPCPAGTYQAGDHCEDCDQYMTSLPAATSIAECYWERCPEENQHIEHGDCVDNEKKCSAPDATDAVRVWNDTLKAYGACIVRECRDGYHISDNACVVDDETCTVANGHGEREWNSTTNRWGTCFVTTCDAGYEINADGTGCDECWNRRVNDEIAVSGYIYGCEIATCMYQGQKYALEMNECVPICSADRYDPNDQSGTITWDERTKKCVRTCNPGYKMW